MEEMIAGLMKKVGLDRATAEKVFAFVKDNAEKVPEWIGKNDTAKAIAGKIPGLGGMFGGDKK
jgi:hypothetical protein